MRQDCLQDVRNNMKLQSKTLEETTTRDLNIMYFLSDTTGKIISTSGLLTSFAETLTFLVQDLAPSFQIRVKAYSWEHLNSTLWSPLEELHSVSHK